MPQETTKEIAGISIDYKDGSRETMDYYALVGFSKEVWHSVMLSPAETPAKIQMNNLVAALCNHLIDVINKEQEENP
jgi:hypothetical protein